MIRWLLSLLGLIALAGPVAAQGTDPLQARADEVAAIIAGRGDLAETFAPAFLAQVPPAQIQAISGQLNAMNGAVQRIERIERTGPHAGTIHVGFERAVARMQLTIEPAAPHRVVGLMVTGSEPREGDTAEALLQDLRALPGKVSFQIARLGDRAPASVAALEAGRPLAIGSAFKLVILAELSRQVRAGQRRWSDVVPIKRHSLPSGITQGWPLGSPATLHTLASLMISISDNTATDVLLRTAGRENVEAMMGRIGMAHAARNRPFLATNEAFLLKAGSAETRAAWAAAGEAARRRMLRDLDSTSVATIDIASMFGGGPRAIDTIEWFASAEDMVRIMDWLRREGDATTHAILAINPGIGREAAGGFGYVGYKGGSEPGVMNMTFLVRSNAGVWHAVTGSWNNLAAAVDEARFAGLMTRAVRLVR